MASTLGLLHMSVTFCAPFAGRARRSRVVVALPRDLEALDRRLGLDRVTRCPPPDHDRSRGRRPTSELARQDDLALVAARSPVCAQAAAMNIATSRSETLLSQVLAKCVLPLMTRVYRTFCPLFRASPHVGSQVRSRHCQRNGSRLPSRRAQRDPRGPQSARSERRFPAREGPSGLGTDARIRQSLRAARRHDPRGAGAGTSG